MPNFSRILIIALLVLGFSVTFYLPYRDVKNRTIESVNVKNLISAKQAAEGIEIFFEHYSNLLKYFAEHPAISFLDADGKKILQQFYRNHSDEISAVTRVDADGKITYTVPFNPKSIGIDISAQAHNRLIIETHQPVVSDMFRAVQGYDTVAFALPIFNNGSYNGCISLLIPFKHLAGKYLETIAREKDSHVWMLSKSGVQLFTPFKEELRKTISKSFPSSLSLIEMQKLMHNRTEGSTEYFVSTTSSTKSTPVKYLAAYTSVNLPQNKWSIAISSPKHQILSAMNSFKNIWIFLMVVLMGAAIIFSYFLIKAMSSVAEEKKLRVAEQKFRELADLLPQIVYESDQNGNVTYTNKQGFDSTGYTEEDLKSGLNASQMVLPEQRKQLFANITKMITSHSDSNSEYSILRKDGTTFPGIIFSRPIIQSNVAIGLRGIIVDITDRKNAEEEKTQLEMQLRQAHKMEAVGTLAGGIAHDFNNILTAILGYAELGKMETGDNRKLKDYFEEVGKAGGRARDLVKHILTFSRQSEQEKSPLQIHLVVNEAIKLIQASTPTTIDIIGNINKECGSVLADPTQIHQVILNLCTNAVHAMEKNGGVLNINLDRVSLTEEDLTTAPKLESGEYLKLSIHDTGHGIAADVKDKIFDPFFTTKDVDQGTGMGLAVVHGIVKNHNGMIIVDSKVGEGTKFDIFFPFVESELSTEKHSISFPATGKEHILLVDDEEPVANIQKQLIEKLGYTVTAVTSSIEAYKTFSAHSKDFDLVITDQTMPSMTGFDLAQELLSLRPNIPIILCTGFSNLVDESKAKSIGIKGFAMKPLVLNEIAALIRKVLEDSK